MEGPRQDKSGVAITEGERVKVLIACDGYQNRRVVVAMKAAPFEGTVVGFSGFDQVVVEDAGVRYSAPYKYIESLKPKARPVAPVAAAMPEAKA